MRKTFYIEITTRKPIQNEVSLQDFRKVPTSYLQCYEFEKKIVQVEYAPGSADFDSKEFRRIILKSLKKQYPRIVNCVVMDEVKGLTS
jgi:hypothetical protein